MKQTFFTVIIFFILVCLTTAFFTFRQANRESQRLTTDLQYRTTLLADSLKDKVEPYVVYENKPVLTRIITTFVDDKRIMGVMLFDNKDNLIASSSADSTVSAEMTTLIANSMDEDKVSADTLTLAKKKVYVFALPLHQDTNVVGSLVLTQNAGFIDDRITEIWRTNIIRLGVQATIVFLAIFLTLRFIIYTPIHDLVESVQALRTNPGDSKARRLPDNFMLRPLIREISHVNQSLIEARMAASEEAKMRIEKLDSPWTEQRLHEYIKQILKDRTIFVVSNREPYIHVKRGNDITYYVPASGMVTAIEPMVRACNGTWIAHGSGSADRLVVDKHDAIRVPPDEPGYTLRRVWLTQEEEKRYYYGFANEGLWPLCHMAHTRPVFREEDWHTYKAVNGKFAEVILKEMKNTGHPLILIQDYHFAALPRMIKNARPDAQIGMFWHIPWPNAEAFGICPYRADILDGMLGADLIGFHTQLHCNNFIETIGRELESLIDWEQFSVKKNSHTSYVRAFPISIAFSGRPEEKKGDEGALVKELNLTPVKYIGVGVDRLDYTKGIIERLKAIELLLEEKPAYRKTFTFIQIAPPSRSQIAAYHALETQVEEETKRINARFRSGSWQPIILLKKHHTHGEINRFFKIANVCLVTSLHDGMNLVAKEFVAARSDEKGVLILSKFAGASRELKEALIINPYDIRELSEAINTSLQMSILEQKSRMKEMRDTVGRNNIYRWSADLLKTLVEIE